MIHHWKSASARWAAPLAALGLLAACSTQTTETTTTAGTNSNPTATDSLAAGQPMAVKPGGAKPAWGPDLHPEMQAVIEQLTAMSGPTPLPKMSAPEARKAPSPAGAAMAVMQKFNIPTPLPPPIPRAARWPPA
ncbi:MAG: hypothetical protein WKG07_34775 [Hymenobacter sp.]